MKQGINLIAGMQGQIIHRKRVVWIARITATVALIAVAAVSFSIWSYRLLLARQLQKEAQSAAQLTSRIASFSAREQRQELIMNRYAVSAKLLSGRAPLAERIQALIRTLPAGVVLIGLEVNETEPLATLHMESSTLSGFSAAIREFESDDFTDVTVNQLGRNQAGEFTIVVVVGEERG